VTLLFTLLTLAVLGVIAAVATGRIAGGLEEPSTSLAPRGLPEGPVTVDVLEAVRFSPALRGYRMEEVDAVLDRMGGELARRDHQILQLSQELRLAEQAYVQRAARGAANPEWVDPGAGQIPVTGSIPLGDQTPAGGPGGNGIQEWGPPGQGRPSPSYAEQGFAAPGYATAGHQVPGHQVPGHQAPSYAGPGYSPQAYATGEHPGQGDPSGYSPEEGYPSGQGHPAGVDYPTGHYQASRDHLSGQDYQARHEYAQGLERPSGQDHAAEGLRDGSDRREG
jgi:DivIVA domain-containing protein